MDLDEQTKNEAAQWRAFKNAMATKAAAYEQKRTAWVRCESVDAEEEVNRAAREIAGYVSLILQVRS